MAEEADWHPDKRVEVWATDEHRIGLKPIRRRVWAPIGERPVALGHHRYEWLYVTAFVAPASGETVWFVSNGIDKTFFARVVEMKDDDAVACSGTRSSRARCAISASRSTMRCSFPSRRNSDGGR